MARRRSQVLFSYLESFIPLLLERWTNLASAEEIIEAVDFPSSILHRKIEARRTGDDLIKVKGVAVRGMSGIFLLLSAQDREEAFKNAISPFVAGLKGRAHAARFSFMAGVMPPIPMLGRSLLQVQSQAVANSRISSNDSRRY